MYITRVFQSGNSQAIRIPKEARTDKQAFYIRKIGEGYVMFPVDDPWFPLRQTLGSFPQDFMEDREQPAFDELPEREGL